MWRSKRFRLIVVVLVILIIPILIYLSGRIIHTNSLMPEDKELLSIISKANLVDKNTAEVRKLLGKPMKIFPKGTPPEIYGYGCSHKNKKIKNELWVYRRYLPVVFIYVGEQNKVEYVHVGWP